MRVEECGVAVVNRGAVASSLMMEDASVDSSVPAYGLGRGEGGKGREGVSEGGREGARKGGRERFI